MNGLLEKVKQKSIKSLRKRHERTPDAVFNECGKSFMFEQLAAEIEADSEFGLEFVADLVAGAIDNISKEPKSTPEAESGNDILSCVFCGRNDNVEINKGTTYNVISQPHFWAKITCDHWDCRGELSCFDESESAARESVLRVWRAANNDSPL